MTPFVITIDGPVASGKGTLSRRLGKTLDYAVLDTGMLYRATGRLTLDAKGDPEKAEDAVIAAQVLKDMIAEFDLRDPILRGQESARAASQVSAHPEVRSVLFNIQRDFALRPPGGKAGAVLDGRDCGTVIFPEAQVKIFLTAALEVRAARRAKDRHGEAWEANFEVTMADLAERDRRDSVRAVAPLKPADGAVILDTSEIDIDEVFEIALANVKEKQG